jgi:hypothetical protein
MKVPAVVRAAARQTRDRASDSPHPRKIEKTIRALVNETPDAFMSREGKIVTTLFVANAEIMARCAPFRTVRQNAPPTGTKLRKEVRQFMTQCSIDLGKSMFVESRIQCDQFAAIIDVARASF